MTTFRPLLPLTPALILALITVACNLETAPAPAEKESYRLTDMTLPDSLAEDWKRMHASKRDALKKFNDDKLGMFIHWGLYSLTSGEWKGERIPGLGEWIMWHAMIPRAESAGLAAQFNLDKFDAAEWVALAKNADMKYIVITAKHHEGFALFPSAHSTSDIADATPSDLLPLDLLYEECQRQDIGLGFYYSHVIDWYDGWCGEGGTPEPAEDPRRRSKANPMNTWDPADNTRARYFNERSWPQVRELVIAIPTSTRCGTTTGTKASTSIPRKATSSTRSSTTPSPAASSTHAWATTSEITSPPATTKSSKPDRPCSGRLLARSTTPGATASMTTTGRAKRSSSSGSSTSSAAAATTCSTSARNPTAPSPKEPPPASPPSAAGRR